MNQPQSLTPNQHDALADSQAALVAGRFIHRKILVRLLLGWLFLNLTIGGSVLWLEIHRIQDFVHALALKESTTFSGESAAGLEQLEGKNLRRLTALAERLVDQHFVVVELYDRNKQLRLEVIRRGQEGAEQWIDQYRHRFPSQGEFSHRFHLIRDNLLLVMLVPLKDAGGALVGYFEGIYQVDRQTLSSIKYDLLRTLLFVTLGITFTTVLMYPVIITLNRASLTLAGDLLQGNLELMNVLGCAIAERDSDTNIHNYRVTFYALRLGEALGLSRENIHDLISGAFLHDVGKIGIRDPILLKHGKLTPEEFDVMKTHVSLGVDIINKSSWLSSARDVVEFHHEKYDGSGYLKGLKGDAIPLNARIFTVVDVFDALTSRRPYKNAWKPSDAIDLLRHDSGSHFDPKLVDIFASIALALQTELGSLADSEIELMVRRQMADYILADA